MSMAWEVTDEDIETVLERLGASHGPEHIEEARDALDCEAVEKAALYGNSMNEQIEYAYDEMAAQFKEWLGI